MKRRTVDWVLVVDLVGAAGVLTLMAVKGGVWAFGVGVCLVALGGWFGWQAGVYRGRAQ